ncbi:hypothetical protein [Pseudofrankia inefficax]|uniref:Uncharacterized protein n=1 Tax=Pseudofrankia inefficax (strain DSM 45817 / CECT 9037 / DDB 130130 / EuI1c) TaxID=298654 RepID=E3IYB5_PSEI1|nr:hypothetical protein [Pseudofrankia inefficax]ADP83860.1 hypothetical protein FraEuI1c_5876 [Pseudofrankia inefficax]
MDVNLAESFFTAAPVESMGRSGGDGATAFALVMALIAAMVLIRLLRAAWEVIAPLVRPVLALACALLTTIIVIVVLLGGAPRHASAGSPVPPAQITTSARPGLAPQI